MLCAARSAENLVGWTVHSQKFFRFFVRDYLFVDRGLHSETQDPGLAFRELLLDEIKTAYVSRF